MTCISNVIYSSFFDDLKREETASVNDIDGTSTVDHHYQNFVFKIAYCEVCSNLPIFMN